MKTRCFIVGLDLILLVVLASTLPGYVASTPLVSFTRYNVDSAFYVRTVFPVDLDNDNDMDIVASGKDNYSDDYLKIVWYENNGSQSFTKHTLAAEDGATTFTAVDMDNDHDVDIIAPSSSLYWGLIWYKNDGNENFARTVISDTYEVSSAHFVDVDKDGDVDIVTRGTGDFNAEMVWWENSGNGAFTHHQIQAQGALGDLHASDMNGDRHIDIVAAKAQRLVWWENSGSLTPTWPITHTVITTTDTTPSNIIVVDLDSDADNDIVGLHASSSHDVVWWENDGAQNFTQHVVDSYFEFTTDVQAADFDSDGDIDLVCAAAHGGIAWYENDGKQNFSREVIIGFAYENVNMVYVSDVNSDGKPDLVSGRTGQVSGTEVDWFANGLVAPGTLKQAHFRIGYDTALDAMTWYAVTDTAAANVPREQNFRVRFQIYNDGGMSRDWQPQLMWSTAPDSDFAAVPTSSGSAPVYIAESAQFNDSASIATQHFALGYGIGTAQAGRAYDAQNPPTSAYSLANGAYTEIEFNLRFNANAAYETLYYFRLTDGGASLDTYAQTAAVETAGIHGTVTGRVVDPAQSPLEGVSVALGGISQTSTLTDGTYMFHAAPAVYTITFTLPNYWTQRDLVTVTGENTATIHTLLLAQSGCLSEHTSCALSLVGLLPVVGTLADLAEVATVGNDLCQLGELYDQGEYAKCAAKLASWIAQAAKIPIISQVLETLEGGEAVQCAVAQLDEAGQMLGKLALAFWNYLEAESEQEVVVVFQMQSPAAQRQLATPSIDFDLQDTGGAHLRVANGTLVERSLAGSYAFISGQGYAVGVVHESEADLTLSFGVHTGGTYDLDVIIPQSDGHNVMLSYDNLTLTPEMSVTLPIITDGGDFALAIDEDGDGIPEQHLIPDDIQGLGTTLYLPLVLRKYPLQPTPGWNYDLRVDDDPGESHQLYVDMASGPDGTLYLVWEDYRDGVYREYGDIRFAYSTNGGQNWSASERVNAGSNAGRRKPRIAVSPKGEVYVVWEDWRNDLNPTQPGQTPESDQNSDIYLAKRPAGQESFLTDIKVLDDTDRQFVPDVGVDGEGTVYVTWYDMRGDISRGNVVVAKSTDSGTSFNPPVIVDNTSDWSLDPRLAVDRNSGVVYVAWQDHRDHYYKPYFALSSNGGTSWTQDQRLDAGSDPIRDWYDAARTIVIAADQKQHVVVAWSDERADPDNCYSGGDTCHDEFDIYLNYSSDAGATWLDTDNVRVNDDSTYDRIYAPDLAFAPHGPLVAVWRDSRAGDSRGDIYRSVSKNYGASWSANTRIDHAPYDQTSDYPAVAVTPDGIVYVAWQDNRNSNWDIYVTQAGIP